MHERRFNAGIERLRAPERIARLEVNRVVQLCLAQIDARNMLDVGVGSAVFAEAFAAHGLEVSGIDAKPEMIATSLRFVPSGHFQLAPAEAIPFPDNTFDLVFLGLVLHETDDAVKALQEARRVAGLGVAGLEWPYRDEEFGPPLAHRLKPETIAGLAQQAGFKAIESQSLTNLTLYQLSV